MVVSRNEIERSLTAKEQEVYNDVEDAIDKALRESWTGEGLRLLLSLNYGEWQKFSTRARNRMSASYQAAGWKLEFDSKDDQRDGFSCYALVEVYYEPSNTYYDR
jgi:hypothetical protein